jgi:hypothetical protein
VIAVAAVAVGMGGDGASAPARPSAPALSDRDGDGIEDEVDRCPDRAGLAPEGCPPRDSDGDGLLDHVDSCAAVAGPADNHGCPDTDSDGDGVVDRRDRCPNAYGDARFDGCDMPDADGDGIADPWDRCPDRAEVWNGTRDGDGCPDSGPAWVELVPGRPVADDPAARMARVIVLPGRLAATSGKLSPQGRKVADVAAALLVSAGARQVRVIAAPAASAKDTRVARAQAEAFAAGIRGKVPRLRVTVEQGALSADDSAGSAAGKRKGQGRIELIFK